MKITTVLTALAAIVLVQAAPLSPSIPRGEPITSSSNTQAIEKRAPFIRPNSRLSEEHNIKRSDDSHGLRKRTFKNVGTPRSSSFNPSGGVGGEGRGDLRKRRSLSPNSVTKTVKRAGGYNPSYPQGGEGGSRGGGYGEGGYGDNLKKRSSSKGETFRKREGELDPVDPFAQVAKGDADLK